MMAARAVLGSFVRLSVSVVGVVFVVRRGGRSWAGAGDQDYSREEVQHSS
jgi:hypothetical protein